MVVSSDDDEILKIAKKHGSEILKRPDKLATDTASTESALEHVLAEYGKKNYHPDFIVLLQPTSPFREKSDLDNAVNQLIKNESDSLLSVVPNHAFLWKETPAGAKPINYDYKNRKMRQDIDAEYRENGSIYVTRTKLFQKENNRLGGKISLYVMKEDQAAEIDTQTDFDYVEFLIKKSKDAIR